MLRLTISLTALFLLIGCTQQQDQPEAQPTAQTYEQVDPATAATIQGVVRFEGQPPKPVKLDMSQDPGCAFAPGIDRTFELVKVRDGKLANVFVYVKQGLKGRKFQPSSEPVIVDQQGCRYLPHVVGVTAGQSIRFQNSDHTSHNVHPMPKDNRPFNESQAPRGEPIVRSFQNPELMIPVKCNQHPWMRMYVNVAEHPFFAVTSDDGSFTIKGLPPGEYTVAAVHEKLGERTVQVKVATTETAKAQFTYTAE